MCRSLSGLTMNVRAVICFAGFAALLLMPARACAQTRNFAENLPANITSKPAPAPAKVALKPALSADKAATIGVIQPAIAMPAADEMLGLIRTTIIALNQANQTGNYTVLRDLAAPDFRNANDASRLGLIFQVLREQAIDLSPLLQISPEVSETPAFNAQGLLRLAGFFPTQPLRVNFDMSFQLIESPWRPYTISVFMARLEAQLQAPSLTVHTASTTKR